MGNPGPRDRSDPRPESGENVGDADTRENDVPNDPRQHRLEGPAARPRSLVPHVLASLALWWLLLVALPAWTIGALVAALLLGCGAWAAAAPLSRLVVGAARLRSAGLARGG